MSNSPLVKYTKISPNRTSPRNHAIDTISIHCVVGQCSLEALGSIFANPKRQASCNYGVSPKGEIGMYVEEKDRSWCTSSSSNDNRAITIEVASDTSDPYAVTDAALAGLIRLLVDICKRNNIKELKWHGDPSLIGQVDKQNMTVHRWFANKSCPGDYLYNLHPYIASEVNKQLNPIEEEEEMTQETFNEMMDAYLVGLAKKEPGDWSAPARAWAEKNKIMNGDEKGNRMYRKFITREELAQVLFNMNGKQ